MLTLLTSVIKWFLGTCLANGGGRVTCRYSNLLSLYFSEYWIEAIKDSWSSAMSKFKKILKHAKFQSLSFEATSFSAQNFENVAKGCHFISHQRCLNFKSEKRYHCHEIYSKLNTISFAILYLMSPLILCIHALSTYAHQLSKNCLS